MVAAPDTSVESLHEWVRTLPASKMIYPTTSFGDRIKYVFWRAYTPMHPWIRDFFSFLGLRKLLFMTGLITYGERQDYLLGTIAPHVTLQSLITFLLDQGYGNHFVAWKDQGQLASLRKNVDFRYQYHVRIFEDGEVRGHYEYTPEYRPWQHLREIGQEDHRDTFLELLGTRVIPA